MQHPVKLSVVVPALNEEANIPRCLESIVGADEVIVVDGGSQDRTRAIAESAGGRVISSPNGRGRQLRAGADSAVGDVLLFLHADSWMADGGLDQLRDYARRRPDQSVFGCFQQRIEDPRIAFRLLELGNTLRARMSLPYGDQAMFVDRRTYDAAGGFPTIPIMEDVVLSRSLSRFGRPTVLPGPVHLSARRWQRHGIVSQTLRNWSLFLAFSLGVSPVRLARWYP